MIIPAYIAHPLGAGPDRASNVEAATEWVCWLAKNLPIAPIADWITLARHWPETMRDQGIAIDERLIDCCQCLIAVGPRMSPGMQIEKAHAETLIERIPMANVFALPVFDWTGVPLDNAHSYLDSWRERLLGTFGT